MSSYPERLPACHCQANAHAMAELHPELRYAEGYLVFPRPPGYKPHRLAHAWNETPGGAIIDPTAWAYAGLGPFRYERHGARSHRGHDRPAVPALPQT